MTILDVQHLGKTYGDGDDATVALADITLGVDQGELVTIVGPSGCGKTTLLRCLSGLLTPTSGTVELLGERVTKPPEQMAIVFQDYSRSLMPWMSVAGNVELPLRYSGLGAAARRERSADALAKVKLGDVADKYPWQLSGGMQQRVAIARALAYRPTVLLMDEPFASVDAQTRESLEDLLLALHHESGLTVLLVTHDIDESVYLADRVVVLTHRPTTVCEEHVVDLPRPRDQIATKSEPAFLELRARVHKAIESH